MTHINKKISFQRGFFFSEKKNICKEKCRTVRYRNIGPVKLPPEDCPPTNSPWVRIKVRVRVGGNFPGGNFLGGNFPCTGTVTELNQNVRLVIRKFSKYDIKKPYFRTGDNLQKYGILSKHLRQRQQQYGG